MRIMCHTTISFELYSLAIRFFLHFSLYLANLSLRHMDYFVMSWRFFFLHATAIAQFSFGPRTFSIKYHDLLDIINQNMNHFTVICSDTIFFVPTIQKKNLPIGLFFLLEIKIDFHSMREKAINETMLRSLWTFSMRKMVDKTFKLLIDNKNSNSRKQYESGKKVKLQSRTRNPNIGFNLCAWNPFDFISFYYSFGCRFCSLCQPASQPVSVCVCVFGEIFVKSFWLSSATMSWFLVQSLSSLQWNYIFPHFTNVNKFTLLFELRYKVSVENCIELVVAHWNL